jgi:hypothetical protein
MSVMQLKKNFIANAGIVIVHAITTAMAATRLIMPRDASIRCLVIESDNIATLIAHTQYCREDRIIFVNYHEPANKTSSNVHELQTDFI